VNKLHLLADVDITSWLSAGGHNVGIVNPLWWAGRSYQVRIRPHDGKYLEPEAWREAALKLTLMKGASQFNAK
jgi:polyhydroxyalkanoate synthase